MAEDDQLIHTRSTTNKKMRLNKASFIDRYKKEVKKRSPNKAAIILIFYSIPAFCCLIILKTIALSFLVDDSDSSASCLFTFSPVALGNSSLQRHYYKQYLVRTLQTTVTYLAFPIMGWVAEVMVGRTRIVSFSLYSMWIGMISVTLSYALEITTCGLVFNIVKYGGIIIGLVYLILGTAGFFANLLAYTLEQMISEPSEKLRASGWWITWGLFIGNTLQYLVFPTDTPNKQSEYSRNIYSKVGVSLIITVLLTAAIVINQIIGSKHFTRIGTAKDNPSKLIWHIMVYAVKQPVGIRRSALTYWNREKPDRLDLAKERNGGPFLDEDVEDVKSFWRIFIVLVSLIGYHIPVSAINEDGLFYVQLFKDSTDFINSHILFAMVTGTFIVLIPILELVIIPCFPRLEYALQSSLRGMGVSYVLSGICLISMIVLDVIGQSKDDFKSDCYIKTKQQYQISFLWFMIPILIACLAQVSSFLFTIQFIMSQAPLRMCGVLTGLFWLVKAVGANVAVLIKVPFDATHIPENFALSCSFWLFLIHFVICCVGMACYVKVSQWYRKRKKNITFLTKEVIEEYYERQMNESSGASYPPLLSKSIDYFKYEAALQNVEDNITIQ